MKRWMIWAAIAVVGVILAYVLLPSPDTGGAISDPKLAGEQEGVARNDADDDWRPEGDPTEETDPQEGVRLNPIAIADPARMGNPKALALREARDTPESRAAMAVSPKLVQVRRLLMAKQEDPVVKPLVDEANLILRDLSAQRRTPDKEKWTELDQRQRQLMGSIRQSPAFDGEMDGAMQDWEQALDSYGADPGTP